MVVAGASREQPLGLGMLGYGDGTWVLTTFGVAKAKPPQSFSAMLKLAGKLLATRFAAALEQAEPIGDLQADDLAREFNTAPGITTYPVWVMSGVGDLYFHHAAGPTPWHYRPAGSLFDQFLGAAQHAAMAGRAPASPA